jgi:hypothetical protein
MKNKYNFFEFKGVLILNSSLDESCSFPVDSAIHYPEKDRKYLTQEKADEYINYLESCKEHRYSEERYWNDLYTWNERHSY